MIAERFSAACFKLCHGRQLVYNTCWEDPRLDRSALQLDSDDRVLVITSAGCNSLDYLLDGPEHVYAVDVNFRQNALLELKIAAIHGLDFERFFALFGKGRLESWPQDYPTLLRPRLSPTARKYWDKHGRMFFSPRRRSFYFCGSSGYFARGINFHIDRVAGIRRSVDRMLAAEDVEWQRAIYLREVKPAIWRPMVRWLMRRDATLSLLGVPRAQRRQLERYYPGGVEKFVEDRCDSVFGEHSLKDNYFWRVYLTGQYTPECCPEYLKPHNFERLQNGLVERVSVHTTSILEFLLEHDVKISRYVLLDHMDWLADKRRDLLARQWQAIVDRAAPQTRLLWRSAALDVDYVDPIEVQRAGRTWRLADALEYRPQLAAELHRRDRVNTYGSFYIADLKIEKESRETTNDSVAVSSGSHVGS